MPAYIAFLRAINVGGHTVKMDVLRHLFESLTFKNVETVIASGNVVFDSSTRDVAALARKIEGHLHESLVYEVRTFIRTMPELANIASYQPFKESDLSAPAHALYVAFFSDPIGSDAEGKLKPWVTAWDEFHAAGTEIYWLSRRKMSASDFSGAVLEKTLKASATLRNITTVRKIAAQFAL